MITLVTVEFHLNFTQYAANYVLFKRKCIKLVWVYF